MRKFSDYFSLGSTFYKLLFGLLLVKGGWYGMLPFLAIYLSHNLGYSPVIVGLILTSGILSASIFGVFSGYISDQIGRKLIIIIALLGSSFSFFFARMGRKSNCVCYRQYFYRYIPFQF